MLTRSDAALPESHGAGEWSALLAEVALREPLEEEERRG